MPPLLRNDAVRMLEAAIESLHIAITNLGSKKRFDFRQGQAEFAVEIGLIGIAAELAMSACLCQAGGPAAILWPSGQYKTAGAVLEDFRTLVSAGLANSAFLTQDVADPAAHKRSLLAKVQNFRRLIPFRAGGVHAGNGLLHEATVVQANDVSEFLELLSKSSRIRPYLSKIPQCLLYSRDRTLLVEDIDRRLREASGRARATALASLYLVLPDIPNEVPEWIDALERVSIAPRHRDVAFLMECVDAALPAVLRRVGDREGVPVPVAVRPDDPHALPINPQFLRRQFTDIPALWHADIATSNGRLENGSIDPPPAEAVREVFALSLNRSHILREGESFTGHQSWAHIVSSLTVQGTPGPYWFLVRRTDDLGQLVAQVRRAVAVGARITNQNSTEFFSGVEAIRRNTPIPVNSPLVEALLAEIAEAETKRAALTFNIERSRGLNRALPDDLVPEAIDVADGGQTVGYLLDLVLQDEGGRLEAKRYWSKVCAEIASDQDDLPSLIRVLATRDLVPAHTAARKALRRIDFRLFGPPVV